MSCVDNGTPGGFSNDGSGGVVGAGPQQSGGVSLSLSAADATPAGSPDPSSLTVLQPANNNQNSGTVYAAAAPTMLPGFTTHYATTGKPTERAQHDRRQQCINITIIIITADKARGVPRLGWIRHPVHDPSKPIIIIIMDYVVVILLLSSAVCNVN